MGTDTGSAKHPGPGQQQQRRRGHAPALDASGFTRVSYSLQAKPGGFSKTLKSCNNNGLTGPGSKPKTLAAYDISCTTVG